MRNLRSEFGHARPSGSRVIGYVRDGRTETDGRTKSKLTAHLPTGEDIIIVMFYKIHYGLIATPSTFGNCLIANLLEL